MTGGSCYYRKVTLYTVTLSLFPVNAAAVFWRCKRGMWLCVASIGKLLLKLIEAGRSRACVCVKDRTGQDRAGGVCARWSLSGVCDARWEEENRLH